MNGRIPQRQAGFILLSMVVFLFVAVLLALGDMRTLAVQQSLVATLYAAETAMVETESALSTMEQFAAYEGSELGDEVNAIKQRTPSLLNMKPRCVSNTDSDTAACVKASCKSFLYPKESVRGDDNVAGNNHDMFRQLRTGSDVTECSFCPSPTLNCKARWDESPGTDDSPWAQFHVNFYRNTTQQQGRAPSDPSTDVYSVKYFYGMVEYLGWAPCNFSDINPTGTNLDAYSGYLSASGDQSRGCRIMRVTVRNQPPTVRLPSITLQSTLVVASAMYLPGYPSDTPGCCYLAAPLPPASAISRSQAKFQWYGFSGAIDAQRISWRQIFPN